MNYFTRKFTYFVNSIIIFPILLSRLLNFFRKHNDAILFINTGKIGDLIVSSILLENDELIKKKVVFLINDQFSDIFNYYSGQVEIIGIDINRFKKSPRYSYKLFKRLSYYHFSDCYNLNAARGVFTEILSLITSANKIYALNNNYLYMGECLGRFLDKYFVNLVYADYVNEYDKHISLLTNLKKYKYLKLNLMNQKVFRVSDQKMVILSNKKYIVIAPFTSDRNRDWPIEFFKETVEKISQKYFVVLIGSTEQSNELFEIADGQDNVLVLNGKLRLDELPSLIANSVLFIGHDSGMTHLALRLNVKHIAIIGGGMYGRFFPPPIGEKNNQIYLFHEMDCFGCGWVCHLKSKECLEKVKPSTIIDYLTEVHY